MIRASISLILLFVTHVYSRGTAEGSTPLLIGPGTWHPGDGRMEDRQPCAPVERACFLAVPLYIRKIDMQTV
jgi:hypothetical protein